RAGRIVYVSSGAATELMGSIAHSTAKAALNTFAWQVAGEAAGSGITVNTVASGAVNTDATAGVFNDRIRTFLGERSVHGRLLEPEDLGRAIAGLTDDAFASVTGQLVAVDGGFDLLNELRGGLVSQFAAG